jgi:hypothetical protein
MDPISLILAALAAGATAAVKDTAGEAVKDAYAGLKALVRRRFGADSKAEAELEALERQPEADPVALRAQLEGAGADHDDEILRVARELLEQLDPDGARAGKYRVNVSGGKGVVVGDNATVTMNFDET